MIAPIIGAGDSHYYRWNLYLADVVNYALAGSATARSWHDCYDVDMKYLDDMGESILFEQFMKGNRGNFEFALDTADQKYWFYNAVGRTLWTIAATIYSPAYVMTGPFRIFYSWWNYYVSVAY